MTRPDVHRADRMGMIQQAEELARGGGAMARAEAVRLLSRQQAERLEFMARLRTDKNREGFAEDNEQDERRQRLKAIEEEHRKALLEPEPPKPIILCDICQQEVPRKPPGWTGKQRTRHKECKPTPVRKTDRRRRIGPKPPCKAPGCPILTVALGYCRRHYYQIRRKGRILTDAEAISRKVIPRSTGGSCTSYGCHRPIKAKGLCGTHYFRQWRAKKP